MIINNRKKNYTNIREKTCMLVLLTLYGEKGFIDILDMKRKDND